MYIKRKIVAAAVRPVVLPQYRTFYVRLYSKLVVSDLLAEFIVISNSVVVSDISEVVNDVISCCRHVTSRCRSLINGLMTNRPRTT